MKRLLTKDGYFPKAGREYELVEFDEFVSVLDHQRFWTLKNEANCYSLTDGTEVVGTISKGKLTYRDFQFDAYFESHYIPRVGYAFSYMALIRPEDQAPFFFLKDEPLREFRTPHYRMNYLLGLSEVQLWTQHKCFFVSNEHGEVLGQFLSESRVATNEPRARGRVQVRSSLPESQRAVLVAALFAVSTMYRSGIFESFGYASPD